MAHQCEVYCTEVVRVVKILNKHQDFQFLVSHVGEVGLNHPHK